MPQLIDQCSTVENGRVYCFPIAFQFKPSYWLPQSKPSSILQLQEIVWGCLILITVNWKYFNLAENIYNRVCGRDSVWRLNIQISEKARNWRKGWVKGGWKWQVALQRGLNNSLIEMVRIQPKSAKGVLMPWYLAKMLK